MNDKKYNRRSGSKGRPAQNSEFKARYAEVPLAEWLRAISLATVEG